MEENLHDLGEHIASSLDAHVTGWEVAHGELNVMTTPGSIIRLLKFLRDDPSCRFACFIDISGVDYPGREKRFDVVYHLLSPFQNLRIRVKLMTDEETPVPSAVELFPAANWYEREAFDLFGIQFDGHPDLRRILTDYGFDGHPLRKDFPVTGFVEVRYSEDDKAVVYEPVRLTQEMRQFDYLSPWEGGHYTLPGDEKAEPDA